MDLFPSLQQVVTVRKDDAFGLLRNRSLHIPDLLQLNRIEIDLCLTVSLKGMDMSRLVIV
jgi:hypothetical protein